MGLAFFSLFRQFTSPIDPLNNNNNRNNKATQNKFVVSGHPTDRLFSPDCKMFFFVVHANVHD